MPKTTPTNPLAEAFEALGDVEAALDRQIYPEQAKADFDVPDAAEYHVVLTAAEWRRYGDAMHIIERALKPAA
jgi:hypothetical protein